MRGIASLLRNHEKIIGVWAQNDIMAAGLIKELHKKRMSVSDDMSVINPNMPDKK
jgi:DNA-binding LacI/PurR family transcriptional regulator